MGYMLGMSNADLFGYRGNGGFFDIFGVFFVISFLLVLAIFVIAFLRMVVQWNENNHSPRLTVQASVVSKRTEISRHSGDRNYSASGFTSYYVTFQVDSGDRMEFSVSGQQYGLLVEGDRGELSFQGARYHGFERV